MYNREHEPHSYPTHSGRPDTYGLAYLTPAKVRSPTGRESPTERIKSLPGGQYMGAHPIFHMGLIWFRLFGRPFTGPQQDEGSNPSGSTS